MRKKRKQYSAQEKVAILRKHLLDKIPVSELCDEYGFQPQPEQLLSIFHWAA